MRRLCHRCRCSVLFDFIDTAGGWATLLPGLTGSPRHCPVTTWTKYSPAMPPAMWHGAIRAGNLLLTPFPVPARHITACPESATCYYFSYIDYYWVSCYIIRHRNDRCRSLFAYCCRLAVADFFRAASLRFCRFPGSAPSALQCSRSAFKPCLKKGFLWKAIRF